MSLIGTAHQRPKSRPERNINMPIPPRNKQHKWGLIWDLLMFPVGTLNAVKRNQSCPVVNIPRSVKDLNWCLCVETAVRLYV